MEVKQADLRDYLAAERTLFAWNRTGLALMGFGFVVARFGLTLQEFQAAQHTISAPSYGRSWWLGMAMIVLGIVMNIFAGWHHARLVRALDRGDTDHSRPSMHAATITFLLALIGLAMVIYLVSVQSSTRAQSANSEEISMTTSRGNGIIDIPSRHSVDETVDKLKGILQAKGVALFVLIDHSDEAQKAGMQMPPTKLLIFGNPEAGTPLMLAAPSSAIDLPLKILIREDGQGKVWVSYNSPEYLRERHSLPPELLQNIAVVEALAASAAN